MMVQGTEVLPMRDRMVPRDLFGGGGVVRGRGQGGAKYNATMETNNDDKAGWNWVTRGLQRNKCDRGMIPSLREGGTRQSQIADDGSQVRGDV